MPFKTPHALFWTDFETTSLPDGNDFSNVHILEAACIITDFDLNPIAGFEEVVKLTKEAVENIKLSEYVLNMHKENGLLVESSKASATIADIEAAFIDTIKTETTFDKGEFMIAGSGVAAFDFPLIKHWMPELASYFAYYPFDIGVNRRVAKILAGGRDLVNPHTASYMDGVKKHRALADTEAHLEEGRRWREFYQAASPAP